MRPPRAPGTPWGDGGQLGSLLLAAPGLQTSTAAQTAPEAAAGLGVGAPPSQLYPQSKVAPPPQAMKKNLTAFIDILLKREESCL